MLKYLSLACLLVSGTGVIAASQTVSIAAVNNPAMIELKKLSASFEASHPEIKLKWVIVEENVLRKRVTTDISTGSGQFDLVFLGLYEAPIFAKRGWLREMKDLPASYKSTMCSSRSAMGSLTMAICMRCRFMPRVRF